MNSILQKKVRPHNTSNPDLLNHLPFDLIICNILPRLPVKSLIRISTTSKTWYSVIKSPQFVASHLKFNRSEAKDPYLMIIDKTCRVLDSQTFVELQKFDFDLVPVSKYLCCHAELCNGLFFLEMCKNSSRKYLLWNPSIRKSREVDTVCDDYKNKATIYPRTFHGLGFNESCKDHRVVRISYFVDGTTGRTSDVPTKVDVYSLSTNSWRRVQADPGRSICAGKGMYLNGAFHWFATEQILDHYFKSILLFDFVDECFREKTLPADLYFSDHTELWEFREFQGSLAALFSNYLGSETDGKYYLWVMTEYGVAESWTRKFNIQPDWGYLNDRLLHGFTKRGDLICMERERDEMNSHDFLRIEYGKFQRRIKWSLYLVQVVDFMERLVLLGG